MKRLLRCEALTPTHVGTGAGEASLDRPTQKNSRTGLPFLPDSALKGVLAGSFGNVSEGTANRERERWFGFPDRGETPGKPGKVVLGNAELLAWPVPTADGAPALAVAATALARALDEVGSNGAGPEDGLRQIFQAVEAADREGQALGVPAVPALADTEPVRAFRDPALQALPELVGRLERLLGRERREGERFLLVGMSLAHTLWELAAEERTLTALDSETGVVQGGSLRTVELIPQGAVFVSLLTGPQLPPDELLAAPIQLGAYENQGLGWVSLGLVELDGASRQDGAGSEGRDAPAGDGPALELPQRGPEMVARFRAVRDLAERGSKELRARARSAVGRFGSRVSMRGLVATLAFELARARPSEPEPNTEMRGHRWLLGQVLDLDSDPVGDSKGVDAALLGWLRAEPFASGWVGAHARVIEFRWLWLRRYVEVLLGADDGSTEPGDGPGEAA